MTLRGASGLLGKVLYGALFVVVLPVLLAVFTRAVRIPMHLPPVPVGGGALAAIGLLVMGMGIADLWRLGDGLPMNAFPPKKLVTRGVYAIVPHPIYSGFVLACAGASLATGSATGLFLTTPIVALCAAALVLGYERPYLVRMFGELPQPILAPSRLIRPTVAVTGLDRLWGSVLASTEKLANSWRAWRFGPVRVISHAPFAAVAGGTGAFVVAALTGPQHVPAVSALMVAGLVGAAFVGQLLVGSSSGLSRPFGYFGGLAGIMVGGLLLAPFDTSILVVLGAFALAGPPVQALGRLRCLVQGCCHGAPVLGDRGITVRNDHSRVCALAGLKGREVYPTQLYSILGNIGTAAILVALWLAGASATLVGGAYLVLAGAVRFVEEGYRGEPSTAIVAGLHIYQWLAVAMVVAGMGMMAVPAAPIPLPEAANLIPALAVGVVFAVACGAAMGVDFPDSQKRFSRLSG